MSHVLDTPTLVASLADYSQQRQVSAADEPRFSYQDATDDSVLFLRVQAAASYYSPNRTLMEHPLSVDVDIILDPFILNLLPRSLGPSAIYLTIVAVGAWLLSDYIYCWLASVADEPRSKDHAE